MERKQFGKRNANTSRETARRKVGTMGTYNEKASQIRNTWEGTGHAGRPKPRPTNSRELIQTIRGKVDPRKPEYRKPEGFGKKLR